MPEIDLPAHGWAPRPAQLPIWSFLEAGGKRAILHAHRRFGKDEVALHWTACAMHERVGTYWHMLPEGEQVRKAIWEAVNPHTGRRRIDEAFPKQLRETTRENEMFIRMKCGSTWQAIGSDNYLNLVGTPPVGLVLSEWAKAHPGAWGYLAPILVENGGWALAITTPEGRNHSFRMHQTAQKDPANWFSQIITVEDNIRMCEAAGVAPFISLADVERQRSEYHDLFGEEQGDALIQQEWFCSFEAAILGAYYGKPMELAEREGRIKTDLEPVKGYPINTAWDIGVDDPMAIWVFQQGPGWLHILDYIEGSNEGFDFYCDWLDERGYFGGNDYVPHDARQRMPTANGTRTRIQELIALKRRPVLVSNQKIADRINAGRRLIKHATFNAVRCKKGLECLRSYKQKWDEKTRSWSKQPAHDWASHGSDAWGYLALAISPAPPRAAEDDQTNVVPLKPGEIRVNDLLKMTKRDRKWA